MDILQAQLSALQALQTSAPQPSLPAHLQTQPVSSVSLDQPASAAQAASEADVRAIGQRQKVPRLPPLAEPPSMPRALVQTRRPVPAAQTTASQVPATSAVAAEESPRGADEKAEAAAVRGK